jgi:hypothetical protein
LWHNEGRFESRPGRAAASPRPFTPKKNQTVGKNSCPSHHFLLGWTAKDMHRVPLMAGVGSVDQL